MKRSTIEQIDLLRRRYYEAIDGKEDLVNLINEAEIAENVYNSNAIENSTLTLEETDKILLDVDLDRYVSQKELFEAKNLARVMEYMHRNREKREMNQEMILILHKMLLLNIDEEIAGRFRRGNEMVRVGSHIAPPPDEITERIAAMLREYKSDSIRHTVEKIAQLHLAFEYTHPFIDGNGRIGRVVNNFLLLKEGFVPINIKFIDRQDYYDAFREYDFDRRTKKMEEIIAKDLLNSYHKRLAYLEGDVIMRLSEYAKKQGKSYSALLNRAKRQTIPAFLEKGVWKIGIKAK